MRSLLFATAVFATYAAVAASPRVSVLPRGEELFSRTIERPTGGEATRRKSIPRGTASIVARVLCGEAARQSDTEARAIVGVILNRAGWRSEGLLDVVLSSNRKGVFAFTAADPMRANGDLIWGRGVPGSRCHARMVRLLDDEWQRGAKHSFTHYWHPGAMKPVGSTPRWAAGLKTVRIGDALFVRVGH